MKNLLALAANSRSLNFRKEESRWANHAALLDFPSA